MAARLNNGNDWVEVGDSDYGGTQIGEQAPLAPILNGDGKIFISIPNYRDGKRCGQTLMDLFQKAKDPDSIVVGIIEQSQEQDETCLESYCKELGYEIYKKPELRKDTIKVIIDEVKRKGCPRAEQIRKLGVHHFAAKGPTWARSLGRKLLGNEEFCLQIDAHMKFVQDWDEKAKQEWSATRNEFAIISNSPLGYWDMDNTPVTTVSRGCKVEISDSTGIPFFDDKGDGKVEKLIKPLLSHTWSSGFSFAKCHLEESAPYDPFTPYVMGVENFARFARFWTRGYDVYTPTQNIVYHNFQPNPDGHNTNEWNHPRDQRFRDASVQRIRTYLGISDGLDDYNLGNLGIYGLGKRRTIDQLESFMRIDLGTKQSRPHEVSCLGQEWIPYDFDIPPTENLFDEPDDLDPQPEYPLRTELAFYQEEEDEQPGLQVLEGDIMGEEDGVDPSQKKLRDYPETNPNRPSPFPSTSVLVPLWLIGLFLWYSAFIKSPLASGKPRRRRKANTSKEV